MNVQQEDKYDTLGYSDIFLSCFSESGTHCVHSKPEHVLLYLYSGEQVIEDRNKRITIKAGECAFIRRDHRLTMYKNSKGKELYKGISLVFQRNVLREFYSKMNKSEIPKDIKISDKNVFKLNKTGCELTIQDHIKVDMFQKTTIRDVFACGDSASPMRSLANAIATGNIAGAMTNDMLTEEEF